MITQNGILQNKLCSKSLIEIRWLNGWRIEAKSPECSEVKRSEMKACSG
jgi:hypothetical protein